LLETEPSLHGETAPDEVAGGPPRPRHISAARASTLGFAAIVVVAVPLLLHWGRRGWFTQDDWDFLSARSAGNVHDLFRAHFQHWVTLPILAYRLMWTFVGLHSYAYYQSMSIALHLVAAALLLTVMRRAGVTPWLATLMAAIFVFFGAGAENILVAFQITFVGAFVFGLVQLLLADHDGAIDRRDWLGLLAGFAGLLCSGVAVTMVCVVGVAALLRRGRRGWRRALFHTAPLALVYVFWLLVAPKGQSAGNYRSQSLAQVVRFVFVGVEAAFARLGHVSGLGFALGLVLIAGLVVLLLGRPRPFGSFGRLAPPFALLGGGVVFLLVTGVARAGEGGLLSLLATSGPERARESRYVYLIVAMLLPALALAADALLRRWRVIAIPLVVILLAGVPGNIHSLMHPEDLSPFANALVTRNQILEAPRLPMIGQLARSRQPYPNPRLAAEGLTFRWLVENAASGKIPEPPHQPPYQVSTDVLRLYLVPAVLRSPVKCSPLPLATERVLGPGDRIAIQGAFVFIRYLPFKGQASARIVVRPSSLVALAGPLRLRIVPGNRKSMLCE
jgi:hypothetical protein